MLLNMLAASQELEIKNCSFESELRIARHSMQLSRVVTPVRMSLVS